MKRAFTLIEAAIFSAVALAILVLLVGFQTRAFRIFDTSTRATGLSQDARKLFEHLTRDARWALLVTQPLTRADWEREKRLVLFRLAQPEGRDRLAAPSAQDARQFPFFADDGDATTQRLVCVRIEYSYDAPRRLVTRAEGPGTLSRTSRRGADPEYAFDPAGAAPVTPMAAHVTRFDATSFALVPEPSLPGGTRLGVSKPDGSPPLPHEIALLAFVYRAEDRPAADARDADGGVLEIATKVWLDERSLGLRYPGFFSSLDTDLEF